MKNITTNHYLIGGLLFLTTLFGCKPEVQTPHWDTEFIAPLIHTNMSLANSLSDTLFSEDSLNHQITFKHAIDMGSFNLDELAEFEEHVVNKSVKLDNITFNDITISNSISLGTIFTNAGGGLENLDGATAMLPDYPNAYSEQIEFTANDIFQSMSLTYGSLEVSIENNLPTAISNVTLAIYNTANPSEVIANIEFPFIESGATASQTHPLDGLIIGGDLTADIINIDLVGTSSPVDIDFADELISTFSIQNIVPYEAIAVLPNQDVFNEDTIIAFDLDEVRLTEILLAEGTIEATGVSTIDDTVKLRYEIPGATLEGMPFALYMEIPPSINNTASSITQTFDFSNYRLDLRGENLDTVNCLYTIANGWIDSTGVLSHVSLENDSLSYTLIIKDLKPKYIKGYLGQDTLSPDPQSTSFDLFDGLAGHLDLEKVKSTLAIENGFGVSAQLNINDLSVTNSANESLSLNGSAAENPIVIDAATDNPFEGSEQTIVIDENNSNMDALIEFFPKTMTLSSSVIINPNDEAEGFLYTEHGINSSLLLEMPLSFSSDGLFLTDTIEFSTEMPSELNNGAFQLIIDNEYPFRTEVSMKLLNSNMNVLESFDGLAAVEGAIVATDGSLVESTRSIIDIPGEDLGHSLNNTAYIIFQTSLSTTGEGYQSVTSQQAVSVKLVGKINQTIGQ